MNKRRRMRNRALFALIAPENRRLNTVGFRFLPRCNEEHVNGQIYAAAAKMLAAVFEREAAKENDR